MRSPPPVILFIILSASTFEPASLSNGQSILVRVMADIAQAGVVRVPLAYHGNEFDTLIWQPWQSALADFLPLPPTPLKKRSAKSSKSLKATGTASAWTISATQIIHAIPILHGRWAHFQYIVHDGILYIRVGILLDASRIERPHSTLAKKIMMALLRAWEWEDVAAMDWSSGGIPPLVMLDKVSRRCVNWAPP
jgi:hypothetical protein